MLSSITLQRYIKKCEDVLVSGSISEAKDLQHEIISVLGSDLDGLKRGLTNYSAIGAFSSSNGKTVVVGDEVDYIKDIKTLLNRLQVELEKSSDMRSMLSAFPTETLVLHKQNGTNISVEALVDKGKITSDDTEVIIEEGDIFERILPHDAKEYYRVIDRGFYKGDHGIPNHYQCDVERITQRTAEEALTVPAQEDKPHKVFISHSSKDADYVSAFVSLLETLGLQEDEIICSSVPPYCIPLNNKVYEWLVNEFQQCELHVVYALSKDYFQSAASLNEMGAAWAMKQKWTGILMPGFSFAEINGCIDRTQIGIKLDDPDRRTLNFRLGELKDILSEEFGLRHMSSAVWDRKRDEFLEKIDAITIQKAHDGEQEETLNTEPVVGQNDVGHIPVEPAFLLVYASVSDGRIIRTVTLGNPPQISAGGKQFMSENTQREYAHWQEALDMLIQWGWVRATGKKGEVYELTGTGYDKADWLKDAMHINTDKEPIDELKEYK